MPLKHVLALLVSLLPAIAASFEVASIKPYVSGGDRNNGKRMIADGMRMSFNGPAIRVTDITLAGLITFAFDLKSYELGEPGSPSWKSEQFDILAKAEGDAPLTRDQFRPLFQSLLAERFQLKFHHETKQTSAYILTVGKDGSKMKVSDPDSKGSMSLTGAGMNVVGWTMDQLAQYFSVTQREPVLNGTGLPDRYDFKLAWSDPSDAKGTYPSLFTAVQEQLGLKLERRKEPIQVFVIDSATRPSLD